jgi:hypothetical protein
MDNPDKNSLINYAKQEINTLLFEKKYKTAFSTFIVVLDMLNDKQIREFIEYYKETFLLSEENDFIIKSKNHRDDTSRILSKL